MLGVSEVLVLVGFVGFTIGKSAHGITALALKSALAASPLHDCLVSEVSTGHRTPHDCWSDCSRAAGNLPGSVKSCGCTRHCAPPPIATRQHPASAKWRDFILIKGPLPIATLGDWY